MRFPQLDIHGVSVIPHQLSSFADSAARRLLLSAIAALPASVFAPVLRPPWIRQRPFRGWVSPGSQTAAIMHGLPLRVIAPQRGLSARGGLTGRGLDTSDIIITFFPNPMTCARTHARFFGVGTLPMRIHGVFFARA